MVFYTEGLKVDRKFVTSFDALNISLIQLIKTLIQRTALIGSLSVFYFVTLRVFIEIIF